MTGRTYVDFPLRMTNPEETEDGLAFSVWVGADLMRQDEAARVVYDEAEFWGDTGLLRDFDDQPDIERDTIFAVGTRLADMAFPEGRVRDLFLEKKRQAGDAGLRIRLMIEIPLLQLLPWEFMHFPQQPGDRLVEEDFLALNPDFSIVRSEILWEQEPVVPHAGQVRFVGLLSDPTPNRKLELRLDREAIESAIESLREEAKAQLVDLQWAKSNTRSALGEALGQHAEVFHYSGHGAFDPGSNGGEGQLILQRANGERDPYPEGSLALDLGGAGVRLVVLGACNTARRDGFEAWSGLALRLVRQKIPAVVGNQFKILNSSAKTVNTHFYGHLFGGRTVDEAITLARKALVREKSIERRDWGVPVLHLGPTAGVLFELTTAAAGRISPQAAPAKAATVDVQRAASRARSSPPYRGIRPFGAEHADIFFGRDRVIAETLEHLQDGADLLVVQGEPGVGKTSVLLAGVAPALSGPVVRVEEYVGFGDHLRSAADGAGVGSGSDARVTDIVAALEMHGRNALVILDQFERAFDMDAETGAADLAAIGTAVNALAAAGVPLVLCSRDYSLGKLEEWLAQVDAGDIARVRVNRLEPAAAKSAIQDPLRTSPMQIDAEVLDWIVADLDDQREGDLIDPTELQIVCESLFNKARDREIETGANLRVDADLYEKGAAGRIIAEHLDDQIIRYFADDRVSAANLMFSILSVRSGDWVGPSDLQGTGVAGEGLALMLRRLESSGFLVRRQRLVSEYALASPAIKHAVLEWAGPEARRVHHAHGVLDGITADWKARQVLPRGSQIDFLASVDRLRPSATEALLLLRAAVAEGRETRTWVEHLEEHPSLLDDLDVLGLESVPGDTGIDRLASAVIEPCAEVDESTEVTDDREDQSAHERRRRLDCRDRRATAALAMVALPDGSDRLAAAVADGSVEDRVAAEIWGALLDAGLDERGEIPELGGAVRRRATWERIRRRMRRDGRDVVRLGIGGAAWAGLGMGLWRGVLAPLTSGRTNAWATEFAFTFVWAAVLAFGLVAAAYTVAVLWPAGEKGWSRWRVHVAATVGFGGAMLLVALANGLSLTSRFSIVIAGFVVGAVLSPATRLPGDAWPWAGGLSRNRFFLWTGVVAVAFAVVQWVLMATDGLGAALPIVRAPDFWGPSLASRIDVFAGKSEGLFKWIAAGDAAVVGVLLAVGVRRGVRRAAAAIAARKELEAGNVD